MTPQLHGNASRRARRRFSEPSDEQPAFGFQRLVMAVAMIAILVQSPASFAEATADFTLAQVMSMPLPSYLTAAPKGDLVAWVSNDKGSRNIWISGRPSASSSARQLTNYTGDDGFDLGELSWDSAGRTLVYSRGGSLEGGGDTNPMSLRSGAPRQTVWTVSIDGAPRPIGPGHAPSISPDNKSVVFLADRQLWSADLSGGDPVQLTHDRGGIEEFVWSPNGRRIAFVSARKTHSLVGVLDLEQQTITWMSPGFDHDTSPEWSPDGSQVAFVRVPTGADWENVRNRREAQPWSIWICNVETGQGRTLWKANPGPGSIFVRTLTSRTLFWTKGDRLVFPWEKTGWLHLYSVATSGGMARELTTGGGFEVFNVSLGQDRERLIYSANATDLDRYHLWEVAAEGGAPKQITRGEGIEDYPVLTGEGSLFALVSDARSPVRPAAILQGAMKDLVPSATPREFPVSKLIAPQAVTFQASDGLTLHGQLFVPSGTRQRRGPAVLFFHGGPIRQMLPGWHPMGAYSILYGMNQYLASQGYVVLSVNYRGGIGYGLNFRQPLNFRDEGASEFFDILGAVQYLRARPDIDPKRIGIYGASYGGLMTALGLSRASDLLAAGVDYAGVHDWRARRPQLSAPGVPSNAAQLAFDSSAISTVANWRSPVLIAHADDDRNVPFEQSVELVGALRKHDVEVEQLVFPDEIHDLLRHESWLTLLHAADDFFGRHLMMKPSPQH